MGTKRCLPALVVPLLGLFLATPGVHAQGLAMKAFSSKLFPYSVSYPSEWKHRKQALGGVTMDTFFAPPHGGFSDNVNIFEQHDAAVKSDAQLLKLNLREVQAQLGTKPQRIGTVAVGGHSVALVAYNMPFAIGARKFSLVETQAMVHLGQSDWYFTLTVRQGEEGALRPVFESMLATFQTH
jgi:hypothetical protein